MLRLLGITHTPEGEPIHRVPRSIKVSIGHRKGKAVHAYIDSEGKWKIEVGVKDTTKVTSFDNRAEAEAFYRNAWKTAPTRDYPSKLPYFTFCRVAQDGESLVADFDAIEAHGPLPTEVPIVLTNAEPAAGAYQYWQTRGLGCSGDGIIAQCKTELVSIDPAAAAEAKKSGQPYYTPSSCWLTGCPEAGGKNCKPHARLEFQLIRQPKIGQKAEIATTSPKSISHIFSAIEELRGIVRRFHPNAEIVGIPLVLSIRAWKHSTPDGRTGKSYAFNLEFRANDIMSLRRELEGHVRNWSAQLSGTIQRQLNAPVEEETTDEAFEDDVVTAAAMVNEFHPGADEGDGDDGQSAGPEEPKPQVNTSKLRERLKNRKAATEEPAATVEVKVEPTPEPEPEPEPTPEPEPAPAPQSDPPAKPTAKKTLF